MFININLSVLMENKEVFCPYLVSQIMERTSVVDKCIFTPKHPRPNSFSGLIASISLPLNSIFQLNCLEESFATVCHKTLLLIRIFYLNHPLLPTNHVPLTLSHIVFNPTFSKIYFQWIYMSQSTPVPFKLKRKGFYAAYLRPQNN